MHRLNDTDIATQLINLPGWELHSGKLHRSFVFADFVEAFSWMTQVAMLAERCNHHPDWRNVYHRVEIVLHTHDAGGLTAKDFELAKAIQQLSSTPKI